MTNHNYFSKIDTEFKAYILGFIYADGCLIPHSTYGNKLRAPRLSLSIQIGDEDIIDKFSVEVKGKPGIVRYTPAQKRANEQAQKIVNVSSEQIYKDLTSLGCYARKTIVGMKFPSLDPVLIPHFIRGFFDGDGCVTVDFPKNNYISRITGTILRKRKPIRGRLTFTSTDKTFLDELVSHLPITGHAYTEKMRSRMVYNLKIERQQDVLDTLAYMYKGCTVGLKRKIEKMNMLISSQVKTTVLKGSETT
jgi:hypothetical protein